MFILVGLGSVPSVDIWIMLILLVFLIRKELAPFPRSLVFLSLVSQFIRPKSSCDIEVFLAVSTI